MYKKKLPLGVRILFAFLSVILCFVLFATTLVTILVADLNTITSKDGLQKIITQTLFPKSAPARVNPLLAGSSFSGLEGFDFSNLEIGSDGLDTDVLADAIYDILAEQPDIEIDITRSDIHSLLEESTIPEFVSDKVSSIVNDAISGEITTTITKDDLLNLVEENIPIIEDTLGIEVETEVLDQVSEWIDESKVVESVQEGLNTALGVTAPSEEESVAPQKKPSNIFDVVGPDFQFPSSISDFLALAGVVSSTSTLLICIGACLVIILLLLLTHWGRPFAAVRSAGIPIMLAGILMLVPSVLANVMPDMLLDLVSEFMPAGGSLIVRLVQNILAVTGTVCLIFALIGLVMTVAGGILNSIFKRRFKVRAAFATAPAAAPVACAAGGYEPSVAAAAVAAAPAVAIPVEETPAEEAPTVEVPAEEIPAEEAPAVEVPAEEIPAEEAPAAEVPAEEIPAEEAPAAEVPAEEIPAGDTPAEEPAETPAEEAAPTEESVPAAQD